MTDEPNTTPSEPDLYAYQVRLEIDGVVAPDIDEARRRVLKAIETGGLAHLQLALTEKGADGEPLGLTQSNELLILNGVWITAEPQGDEPWTPEPVAALTQEPDPPDQVA